jgi:hypothetical protein
MAVWIVSSYIQLGKQSSGCRGFLDENSLYSAINAPSISRQNLRHTGVMKYIFSSIHIGNILK